MERFQLSQNSQPVRKSLPLSTPLPRKPLEPFREPLPYRNRQPAPESAAASQTDYDDGKCWFAL